MSSVCDERAVYFSKYLHLGGDEAHSSVLVGNDINTMKTTFY